MHFRYRLPHCDQNWCTILVDSAAAVTSQRTDKVQGFANKDFQRYKVIHTDGDRRFGCAACGKRFRTWNALNDHVRLHSRANPYQCTVCDKCFRTHGYLPGEYTKDVDRIRVPCVERVSHSRAALPHTCTHIPEPGLTSARCAKADSPRPAHCTSTSNCTWERNRSNVVLADINFEPALS